MQFQGSLAQWFVLLQYRNYTKLTFKKYVELSMRIEKSLILDFERDDRQCIVAGRLKSVAQNG